MLCVIPVITNKNTEYGEFGKGFFAFLGRNPNF
jgi:hypothetical protein